MAIQLNISPRIIPNISTLYNDVNRIFLEYIDNSLDSAESFYDPVEKEYSKHIKISVRIEGRTYKDSRVIIKDNCNGINNFRKVVESIGNSDKKADFTTNGQFGYGIYSFMATCDYLKIISKEKGNHAFEIPIKKHQFDADHQKDVRFPEPEITSFEGQSGTQIILEKFSKDAWRQVKSEEIKCEIEKHFEMLIRRGNISISVMKNNKKYECVPFDYEKYADDKFIDKITSIEYISGRKYQKKRIINLIKDPIEIYLYITRGKVINRAPVFVVNGRRIAEIKDIKSFKSRHKGDLWNHPNITGFIDLKQWIEPTIARTDFRNCDNTKAVFNELYVLEDVIIDEIKNINKTKANKHYRKLEDCLNSILKKLAKKDKLKFINEKKQHRIGKSIGSIGSQIIDNEEIENVNISKIYNTELENKNKENNDTNYGDETGDSAGTESGGDKPFLNVINKQGNKSGKLIAGFNIIISEKEPDENVDGESIRSEIIEGSIIIYRKHPEFENRVTMSRKGEVRISERLIMYLVSEIAIHYKDKYYSTYGEPEYSKQIFNEFIEFIYEFENELKEFAGKNLSSFTE